MKKPLQRDNIASMLFGMTEDSVETRNRWRLIAFGAAWLVLSGFSILMTAFTPQLPMHRAIVIGLSFIKYVPLLWVAYSLAKQKAAHYLADIYELQDEDIAMDFIEEVAFGYGHERITINDGRISDEDEHSPIILIGGPGQIQVNLGSAALLEKLDGEPEVIHARGEAWDLGRFERIREIGKRDEIGKREYAVINLRDQFVSGLSVRTRTKDGIPIEALDIKVLFSVLRHAPDKPPPSTEHDPYPFEKTALHSLVYNQTIITPPPTTNLGVTFPWDTSVIPLVITELERLITTRTLSEILSSISQKEMDAITLTEETVTNMRVEMTGGHTLTGLPKESRPPNFESRTKISAQFLGPEFRQKAADLGITVEWIDVGNWHLPSTSIAEKLKAAWTLTRENARRRNALERSAKKHQMNKILQMVNEVVIENYERNKSSGKKGGLDEWALMDYLAKNPSAKVTDDVLKRFTSQSHDGREDKQMAARILRAFRKELITARDFIQKEDDFELEHQAELARIEKALKDISQFTSHYV